MPPLSAIVGVYATPTVPAGSVAVVIANVAAVIVSVRLTVAVCCGELESTTLNASTAVLAAVGVPLNTPPAENDSALGKFAEVIDHV